MAEGDGRVCPWLGEGVWFFLTKRRGCRFSSGFSKGRGRWPTGFKRGNDGASGFFSRSGRGGCREDRF